MTLREANSWILIREELLRRIHDRIWKPGDLIPGEAELAEEFGCARTTVNRALRDLAETGLVTRRRKAGTRIAINPPHKATLTIPIVREEVEARVSGMGDIDVYGSPQKVSKNKSMFADITVH